MATANVQIQKSTTPGGRLNPRMVFADITFSSGKATVTAAELGGASTILSFFGSGPYGGTTGLGYMVTATTAYAAAGYTSLDLELIDDASNLVDAKTACCGFLVQD